MMVLGAVDWHAFFFVLFALLSCVFAVAVLFSANIVRMAFYLTLSLGATSGLFFLAGAEFVGAMQLMIYVGGTLVLLIFGVMLTAQQRFISMKTSGGEWILAVILGSGLFLLLLQTALSVPDWQRPHPAVRLAEVGNRLDEAALAARRISEAAQEATGENPSDPVVARMTREQERAAALLTNLPAEAGELVPGLPAALARAGEKREELEQTLVAMRQADSRESYVTQLQTRASDVASAIEAAGTLVARRQQALAVPLAESKTTTQIGLAFAGARVDTLQEADAEVRAGMSGYLLPFVIVSVHLLVVLVGAAYMARTKRRASAAESP